MRFEPDCLRVVCALALAAVPLILWAEPCGELPVWSTGDLEFCVDFVSFQGDRESNEVLINCSVANDQIRFVEDEETGEARGLLLIEAGFEDEDGRVIDREERQVVVKARSMLQAEKRDVIQVVQLERRIPHGRYLLTVMITDLRATKVGIWYALRNIKRSGEVSGIVVDPNVVPAGLGISDIAFARHIQPDSTGTEFTRSGLEIVPNPSRIYGLRLPELTAYVEVYDNREPGGLDTLMAEYLVLDGEGERVHGQTRVFVGQGSMWRKAFSIPLVGLMEGSYRLAVNIEDTRTMEKASTEGCFDIMWSMLSWDRSLEEGLEDLSLILSPEELEVVSELSPGERESYMRGFWKSLDPTPETVQNETLQEYYRRVKYANEHFSAYRRGMFTDQGRLYIKYGPADDIRRGAAWGSGPGTSEVAFPTTSDRPGSPGHSSVDELGLQFREMGIDESGREAQRLANLQAVGKTYEIWVYDRGGKPLSGEWAWKGSGQKLKFVFVDQRGYGDLQLVYSSAGEDY